MQNSSNHMVRTRRFRWHTVLVTHSGVSLEVQNAQRTLRFCTRRPAQAHVNFLGKQSSSCSDARKGQTCFPILMGKLILGPPWLSFLGGQRIPVSHIPSTHHAALIRDPVESGSSLSWSYRVCRCAVGLAKIMNLRSRVAWQKGSQNLTWDGGSHTWLYFPILIGKVPFFLKLSRHITHT